MSGRGEGAWIRSQGGFRTSRAPPGCRRNKRNEDRSTRGWNMGKARKVHELFDSESLVQGWPEGLNAGGKGTGSNPAAENG